jgi:hypothetical protein
MAVFLVTVGVAGVSSKSKPEETVTPQAFVHTYCGLAPMPRPFGDSLIQKFRQRLYCYDNKQESFESGIFLAFPACVAVLSNFPSTGATTRCGFYNPDVISAYFGDEFIAFAAPLLFTQVVSNCFAVSLERLLALARRDTTEAWNVLSMMLLDDAVLCNNMDELLSTNYTDAVGWFLQEAPNLRYSEEFHAFVTPDYEPEVFDWIQFTNTHPDVTLEGDRVIFHPSPASQSNNSHRTKP